MAIPIKPPAPAAGLAASDLAASAFGASAGLLQAVKASVAAIAVSAQIDFFMLRLLWFKVRRLGGFNHSNATLTVFNNKILMLSNLIA